MKKLFTLVCTGLSLAATAQPFKKADVIIRHVNVVPMDKENVLADQVVCIDKGKISYIGEDKGQEIKTQGKVVDAKGQYLMPGLAEMHCHLPEEKAVPRFFDLNLAAGVTVLRSMRGKDWHLKFKGDRLYQPRLYLGAPVLPWDTVINEDHANRLVSDYKTRGFDHLKLLSIKDSNSFKEVMQAAKTYDMPVCGHMLWKVNYETVLNSGYSSLEHLDWQLEAYDSSVDYYNSYLALAEKNKTWHCPTFDFYQVVYRQIPEEQLLQRTGMQYIPDSVKQKWMESFAAGTKKRGAEAIEKMKKEQAVAIEKKRRMVKEMSDRGMGLLVGADPEIFAVPGFGIVEEMKAFKDAGLSNYKVLEAATISAAKYLHADKEWGTIEKGKCANCILLARNPLEDITAVSEVKGVFLDKDYYSEKELKARLN
ncbi:MAG: isoaspartyl dipeptidase [Flavipsychrobacter sp.]|jgi:hypothetical protein|nr:isoaspartyl dipeptidase [Flavipsychrobacter sp.]